MSLKMFHLVFITAAILLAFGCAIWGFNEYWTSGGRIFHLLFGIGSIISGVGLIVYERYFLKKLKKVSYL